VKDWAELNRNLFSALKLEKAGHGDHPHLHRDRRLLQHPLHAVHAGVGEDEGDLHPQVDGRAQLERDEDLRAGGSRIGGIGTAMGLLLGLASCSFIERFGLQLDPDVYYISNLPVNVDGGQFLMVAAIAVALSYLATLYPATKASRLSPVDGLREE